MNNHQWAEFRISDIFEILPGKRLTKADMTEGKRPFIGATDSNNGITAWVDNINESIDRHCLGVNYNGSVGETFYHPYECIFSDDVKRLHLKEHLEENHYVMLFLKTAILQQKVKYAYGYKFNESRMQKQVILLPSTANGTPDWQFMENYMRQKEQQILKPTIDKLCKQLIYNQIGGGNATSSTTHGKRLILPMFLPTFNVANASKKLTIQKAIFRMCPQRRNPMVSMALLETQAA